MMKLVHSVSSRRNSLDRRDESERDNNNSKVDRVRKPVQDTYLLVYCQEHCKEVGMCRDTWLIQDFKNIVIISKRHTSIVMQGQCNITNKNVVMKSFDPGNMSPIMLKHLQNEMTIHGQLSHPHIIKMYAAFKQGRFFNIAMQHADGGSLYNYLIKRNKFTTEYAIVKAIVKPLLQALKYIHSKRIVHRDIKLENVLIHQNMVKLADFGVSIDMQKERPVTCAGTTNYQSPEVLACPYKTDPFENKDNINVRGYGTSTDIWSFGVLIYECLNMASPYATQNNSETRKLISSGSLPSFIVPRSDKAINFVYSCLRFDPFERPTARELLSHPWIASFEH